MVVKSSVPWSVNWLLALYPEAAFYTYLICEKHELAPGNPSSRKTSIRMRYYAEYLIAFGVRRASTLSHAESPVPLASFCPDTGNFVIYFQRNTQDGLWQSVLPTTIFTRTRYYAEYLIVFGICPASSPAYSHSSACIGGVVVRLFLASLISFIQRIPTIHRNESGRSFSLPSATRSRLLRLFPHIYRNYAGLLYHL